MANLGDTTIYGDLNVINNENIQGNLNLVGSFGIGTTSPEAPLHINFNTSTFTGINYVGLVVDRSDYATSDSWVASIALKAYQDKGVILSGGGDGFKLMTYNGSTGTDRFTIFSSTGLGYYTGNFTVTGNITCNGSYNGNGSGLTTLNASNLSSGTVPDARITGAYTGITTLTCTTSVTAPTVNATTGFKLNNTATSAQYLRGNGTNIVLSAIQASDVPTLNQNTTGSAGSVPGTGVTGTTLASNVVTSSLTTVGVLASGSITTTFGNINIGTSTFTGNGSGLNTLNASNLSSGTVPDARITGAYTGITTLTCTSTVQGTRFISTQATGTSPFSVTSTTVNTNLNADMVDGYHVSTTANAANTIPVRNASGYIYLGWINTTSGETTSAISRIYASNDSFIRYYTPEEFASQLRPYLDSSATIYNNAIVGRGDTTGFQNITINTLAVAASTFSLTQTRTNETGSTNGSYQRGLINGGSYSGTYTNIIDYITINAISNAIDFGDLSSARYGNSSTSNRTNNRGITGGGYNVGPLSTIDYVTINTTGNASIFGQLASSVYMPAACSNAENNRGIFSGGSQAGTTPQYNTIQYINIASTGNTTDFGDLTYTTNGPGSTSNGKNERGIVCGGNDTAAAPYNYINYFTITSPGNATTFGTLYKAVTAPAVDSNKENDRCIICGGSSTSGTEKELSHITISSTSNASYSSELIYFSKHLSLNNS